MSLAKGLLDVGRSREADSRRIRPQCAANGAVFVKGLVDHVPRVHLAGIAGHYGMDVILE